MHATEREQAILELLRKKNGFISFRELEERMDASAATLRRDLGRMAEGGQIERVRGGARIFGSNKRPRQTSTEQLSGIPFHENINRMPDQKRAIGKSAANLCEHGTSVMIDGGSTTLQMCGHLADRSLQVFTNSLHIVSALLPQTDIRILVPGGNVFREQDIILSAVGDDTMPRFHARQLFMGAATLGPQGIMQPDTILVAAERRLLQHVDELIVLVDHTKFRDPSGNVVCGLEEIDVVVTDEGVDDKNVAMLESAGIKVLVAMLDE